MPPDPTTNLDKNVSPNWRPVAGLSERKPGIAFSDRLWHWLVSLGGLALIAIGVAVFWYLHRAKWGGALIGIGLAVFALGSPSQAARNGYRSS